ncbi:MAG: SCO family protein, partial [Chloroflexota bacterium]
VLQPIWDSFFVFREKAEITSDNNYLMNHSTRVIVVDKTGRFRMTFPYGIGVEAMHADLVQLIAE